MMSHHMSFRLVPNSVTLNDLEWRNNGEMAATMRYFTEIGSFPGTLRKIVEDEPTHTVLV